MNDGVIRGEDGLGLNVGDFVTLRTGRIGLVLWPRNPRRLGYQYETGQNADILTIGWASVHPPQEGPGQ